MRIVFCIDKKYVELASVSIASYRKWNPSAEIIVVSEEPMPKSIGYDTNMLIKLPKLFRNRGEGYRITNTAYLKIFLTELPYKKILYVDADTICQKPLNELWDMPCKYINIVESHNFGKKQAQAIGNDRYGNTGMMVMNLNELRKINFTNRCLNVEENYPTPTTGWQHDETCINVAIGNYLTYVDKKFNYCHNRKYDDPIEESDAYILHYIGTEKMAMIKGSQYREMGDIGKYIHGKRVAIVGNAKSIFEKQYGKEIDDHDFVIRFNKGMPIKPESQGTKTGLVLLACELTKEEINAYHPLFIANRSKFYNNPTPYVVDNQTRAKMTSYLNAQPSTGFIAIDMCMFFEAKSIDLYGFDWEATPTYYNPEGYQTQHNYSREREIVALYNLNGIVKINS